ncbi:MAG: lipopolysaccharide biosynthesis protein [Armatimonadota bacterium]
MRRDVVMGVGWAFLSSSSVRAMQVLTTLILAKLLQPHDFGIFALSSLIINAAAVLRDVGFAQVVIYRQADIRKTAGTALTLTLMSSLVLAMLLGMCAPLLSSAFSSPEITLPVRVMSVGLLISGMASVPSAILDKYLKFRKRAIPEILSAVVYAVTSLILAKVGFAAWSLIIGWMAMSIVNTAAIWSICPTRPSFSFDSSEARVIVGYGKHLMVASLATFAFFQIDNASIGKWLGMTALGFYSMAFTICNLPATNLAHIVQRVMFPAYSQLQDNTPEMTSAYLKTIRYIALAAFPAATAIFVLAGSAIRVLYGAKWVPAVPLFGILAIYGAIRSVGSTANAVFMSTGRPNLSQQVSLLQIAIVTPLVYPVVIYVGAKGVALLFTVAYTLTAVFALVHVFRILDLNVRSFANSLAMPLCAAVLTGILIWLVLRSLASHSLVSIICVSILFCMTYALLIRLLDSRVYKRLTEALCECQKHKTSV